MGIFDALNTSVAGLQAQSFALQNISGNIANASTVGYKGIDTNFEDLIPGASALNQQVAGSVTAFSQQTITTAGTVSASSVATNMAINGDGFFSVQQPSSTVDGQPVFSGATDYTRRGDFQVDANGNLVNGAGYYLMGVPVDPKTGNPLGSVPEVLQFQNNFLPAQATTTVQYAANLPSTPQTQASSSAPAGSLLADGGMNTGDFSQNPLVVGTPPQPFGDNTVVGQATDYASATSPGEITASTALSSHAVGTIIGTAELSLASTPISASTALAGTSSLDTMTSSFADGDTITVNGKTITFSASDPTTNPPSSSGGTINLTTGTVKDILSAIDAISGTGTASTVSASGAITLNDDKGPLTITTSSSSTAKNALGALGFGTSGTASSPANAISSSFAAGEKIVVDGSNPTGGTTLAFYDSNGSPPTSAGPTVTGTTYIDLATATIGDLLSQIDSIQGNAPGTSSVSNGQITLHSGTTQDLSIMSTDTGALNALGFSPSTTTNTFTVTRTGGGTSGTGAVIGNDVTAFDNESISGGAVTAYTASGTPVNIQLRWVKSDSSTLGSPHQDTWNLFYQVDPNATGTTVAWQNVGQNFVFNPDGSLSAPTTAAVTIPGVSIGGQSLGDLSLDFGSSGLTQFASTSGAVTINTLNQNGYAAGQLQSVAVNNSGLVVGTFSNGQNIDLAEVTLVHFNGTNYLQALDGGAYAATEQSGAAIAGAQGTISGSSLEGSNTDIADEFTKLIVTQQVYSANTKVITTANDMVQDLLNVLR
jgi:flagellar hook protein FlgE